MTFNEFSSDQISSNQCDVVTGFHIEDTKKHIFVLEGLHWKGLQKVWKEVPHHTSEGTCTCMTVLCFIHHLIFRFKCNKVFLQLRLYIFKQIIWHSRC